MNQYNYMTFKSVSYAMKAEAELKKNGIKYKMILVPRSISSSCGLCVRFYKNDMNKLNIIIEKSGIDYEKIYEDVATC